MHLAFFVIPVIVMIPILIYLYIWFNRFLTLIPRIHDRLRHGLAALLASASACLCWPIYRTGGVVISHFLVSSLLMELIHLIIKKKNHGGIPRVWSFLYRSGILSAAVVAAVFTYGYINMQTVYERSYEIASEKVQRDMKFAAISDLHLGTNMDTDKLSGCLDGISSKTPDALLLVGDIFDESTGRDEMKRAAQLFGQVKSTFGTYYVLGNHDPNRYVKEKQYTEEEMCQILSEAGVHVLQDETAVLDGLTIIGRRDASAVSRQETKELTARGTPSQFTLLLDHQPLGLQNNADAGVDLQISGHTHAGQIWPTGKLMELLGVSEMNYGYKKIDTMNMIVTSGIGGWGYPIRTGGHCEYVIIDVKKENRISPTAGSN